MNVQKYNCLEESCDNEHNQVMPIEIKYTIKRTVRNIGVKKPMPRINRVILCTKGLVNIYS